MSRGAAFGLIEVSDSNGVMQDLYHQPEFCGSCHKANLPVPLNDYKWIRAFTAYDEWQNSKLSKRNQPQTPGSALYFMTVARASMVAVPVPMAS
jgi:hypothetical protein